MAAKVSRRPGFDNWLTRYELGGGVYQTEYGTLGRTSGMQHNEKYTDSVHELSATVCRIYQYGVHNVFLDKLVLPKNDSERL